MMRKLENIYRFFDLISTIVRNIRPLYKTAYYILFSTRIRMLKPKNNFRFEGRKIYFSNFNSTLYSLEEIFFYKSIDFKAENINPVIIDAGANVGISALYYKKLYPNA